MTAADATKYNPATHYDRVTEAWSLLLGDELHYGVFAIAAEDLATATDALTHRMVTASRLAPGLELLDVGCGTGAPACTLASRHGVRVTGITTSSEGVAAARKRSADARLDRLAQFALRDGADNGFPDATFDRVWALESSHLMRDRARLIAECTRVLLPGGRLALCDITLRRPMDLREVRRLRQPLALLREVFGDARMEPLSEYRRLLQAEGLTVDVETDLTASTRPTFDRWVSNAHLHRKAVSDLIGPGDWRRFVDACHVLRGFWDDGTLGYGLIAAAKPG